MAADWHNPTSARLEWAGAPAGDAELSSYLDTAKEMCLAFLDLDAPQADIYERWRLAQLMQAQALWQSRKASPNDTMGFDSTQVNLYSMDSKIRKLLMPPRGMPGVG